MEKYRAEIFSFSRILNLFDAFVKFLSGSNRRIRSLQLLLNVRCLFIFKKRK